MKQIHARKDTLKKIHALAQKNSYKRNVIKRNSCRGKISHSPQHFSNGTIQILFFNEHYQCNSIYLKVLFSFSLSTLVMAKIMSSVCVDLGAHSFIPIPHPFKIYLVQSRWRTVARRLLDGRTFPRVTGGGWRVAGSGQRVAGSGWRVVGQAVKNKKIKIKRGNQKRKNNNKHYKKRYFSNIILHDIACTRQLEELIKIKVIFILRPDK